MDSTRVLYVYVSFKLLCQQFDKMGGAVLKNDACLKQSLLKLASSLNHFGLTSSAILWAMSLILPAVARDMVPNSNKSANGKDEKKNK